MIEETIKITYQKEGYKYAEKVYATTLNHICTLLTQEQFKWIEY